MLKQRVITACLLAPPFILAILFLPSIYIALLFGFVITLGSWEWGRLSGAEATPRRVAYSLLIVALMVLGWWLVRDATLLGEMGASSSLWWLIALAWVISYNRQPSVQAPSSGLRYLLGIVVMVPCWAALLAMHESAQAGPGYVLYLVMMIWAADIAAYFSGKAFGRRKLAPNVSPGKSVEGVAGAVVAVAIYALIGALLLNVAQERWLLFVALSVVATLFSVLGDLFESLLKRATGIKDSGSIMPGHGGVLDRIDSITAAAPIFALGLIASGVPL
jgi:phosphatidate cytidylyltransferase